MTVTTREQPHLPLHILTRNGTIPHNTVRLPNKTGLDAARLATSGNSNMPITASGLASRLLVAATTTALTACTMTPPPADPTSKADTDMVRVLTVYRKLGALPLATLTVEQARMQPTPGRAAMAVQQQTQGNSNKLLVAKVYDTTITGAAGPLSTRIYDPRVGAGTVLAKPAPVILYFHGGGWVTGDLDTYDASSRALAAGTGAIVVSVAYRLAPEARFPAAQDDADNAYDWLLTNAGTIGGDPKRIALAGESAGGNLAIDTAIWARDSHLPAPVAELLIYPVVGTDLDTPSYRETANAIPLNKAAIQWYVGHTTTGPADLADKRLDVIGEADLHGLPAITIVSAEIDPLRSEAEMLATRLQAAGVDVQQETFPGVTHDFFGMGSVIAQAKLAETYASTRLSAAFVLPVMPGTSKPASVHHRRHIANRRADPTRASSWTDQEELEPHAVPSP